jgi:hypothetical protein
VTSPTGATGPTGPGGSPVIAAAIYDGATATIISTKGLQGFIKLGVGIYEATLTGTPPPNANCVVNVTTTTARDPFVSVIGAGVVHIETFNTFGQTAFRDDTTVHITVMDDR